jgi:hypothetical protein
MPAERNLMWVSVSEKGKRVVPPFHELGPDNKLELSPRNTDCGTLFTAAIRNASRP